MASENADDTVEAKAMEESERLLHKTYVRVGFLSQCSKTMCM